MAEIIASTYEIIGKIGSGGGGNVFLANHLRLGKRVVLKADKRRITTRPELLRREVDVLKDLSHPHIPAVYDFFVEGETVYTVMDYIEGESLDRPLKRGQRFSQPQVIQWAKQLLGALSYLHSPTHGEPPRGFVHSDIKPANLMVTADQNLFLIDFNIALALGEENVIGCSAGYASPEHYGLDFSTDFEEKEKSWKEEDAENEDQTEAAQGEYAGLEAGAFKAEEAGEDGCDRTEAAGRIPGGPFSSSGGGQSSGGPAGKRRTVVPDVRSDIYSTGATLYHLLSGRRPPRDAKEVVPLSEKEFSPQVVKIIAKAMEPNPDLRYQTAEEMLWDFTHLRERDPRVRRQRREWIAAGILFSAVFLTGISSSFVGLKRMQTAESWLKLAEYSKNAWDGGDPDQAAALALKALPQERGILTPDYAAEAIRALSDALGVYDLADGYKKYKTVELPSAPLWLRISPDGRTAACMYAWKTAVVDLETGEILAELLTAESALSEAEYLDETTIACAGADGLLVYDIEEGKTVWQGGPATAVAVSGDKKSVAAVYRDEPFATVYGAEDGQVKAVVDFGGRSQQVTVNDSFANPGDLLLELNGDGTRLAASFADGSLEIFELGRPEEDLILFEAGSGYFHFEGGFYGDYFACSATGETDSVFSVIDTVNAVQTGGFKSKSPFGVQADESGIYVQTENILTKIHPVTGEQTPLVTTPETILTFARSSSHTLIATKDSYQFFGRDAELTDRAEKEGGGEFLGIAAGTAVMGGRDEPKLTVMKYESHPEQEIFSYDPSYRHDEARVSADGSTVMLFSYDQFRLYRMDGELIAEGTFPDAKELYDQQYRREGQESYLELIYNDGRRAAYSARDGSLLRQWQGEKPDLTLYEEFETDRFLIKSPLHGAPSVCDRKTGKALYTLKGEDYLTYVTQAGEYLVVQYVTADGYFYGQLLNEDCEVIADLPYLSDVIGERLIFDYPTGNMRETRIYNIDELIDLAYDMEGGNMR